MPAWREKLPAQSDSLDLRGASAPASDTGPYFTITLGVQKQGSRDTPPTIFRDPIYVNDSRLRPVEKTKARSATVTDRFAPRRFQQSIRLLKARAQGAAATIALMVQKSLSTAPMLMYQHSRSGVCWPGR